LAKRLSKKHNEHQNHPYHWRNYGDRPGHRPTLERRGRQGHRHGTKSRNSCFRKKTLSDAVVLRSDSGDLAAAQALGDEIKTFAEHLDGTFLNAGIGTIGPFDAATPKDFDDMFNVNVRGPYFQLQSLLPLLGNPSSVVFTSSIAGSTAFAGTSIYSATKAPARS
jgi:NAD(P)-dependent dehydrogenase (short-subunit alcohol dehydrogenase family)